MKVLLIGKTRRLFGQSNFQWLEHTLCGLKRLGHDVTSFGYPESWFASKALKRSASAVPILPRLLDRYREGLARRQDRRLIALARGFRPDLVLVVKGENLSSEVLAAVKKHTSGPVVTWWADDPWRFPGFIRALGFYDHVFIWDRAYLAPLRAAGAREVHFLPAACDETVYQPAPLSRSEMRRFACDVSFVAWFYPRRGSVVRAFSSDVDLAIWGGGWRSEEARGDLPHPKALRGSSVSTTIAAKIYRASKLGLNVHHEQTREAGLNNRTFEQLASGLCPLVDHVPGIEELLNPGSEVVCYGSPDEAYELAKRFLKDETARRKIASRGRTRVLAEHTYAHRLRRLIDSARG